MLRNGTLSKAIGVGEKVRQRVGAKDNFKRTKKPTGMGNQETFRRLADAYEALMAAADVEDVAG